MLMLRYYWKKSPLQKKEGGGGDVVHSLTKHCEHFSILLEKKTWSNHQKAHGPEKSPLQVRDSKR